MAIDIGNEIEKARPKMLSMALRSLSKDDAEDVVQETILRCLQSHEKATGTIEGWMVGILRRVLWEMGRTREREEFGIGRLSEHTKAQQDHSFPYQGTLPIPPLPSHLREVVELRAEGMTYEEIGVRMGITPRAVRYRLKAARRMLKGLQIETGFESAEELFYWCSMNTVYRKPTSAGSGVARLRQGRMK